MKNNCLPFLLFFSLPILAWSSGENRVPLDKKSFDRHWLLEAESPLTRIDFMSDTLQIAAPGGATLWLRDKMSGDVVIEYDACVMDEGREGDRVSDLNCFWMASDPQSPDNLFKNSRRRAGVFENYYALQLYYVGFGGNGNTTTRFRRYTGDEEAVQQVAKRPPVLVEYSDKEHLLTAGRWMHIRLEKSGNRVCYYCNGERWVDYRDDNPLQEGWFGLRTTRARVRIAGLSYSISQPSSRVALHWIGLSPQGTCGVTWGVPFSRGEVNDARQPLLQQGDRSLPVDYAPLAYWDDGSVKWGGFSSVIPLDTLAQPLSLEMVTAKTAKSLKGESSPSLQVTENGENFSVKTGKMQIFFSRKGALLWDSLLYNGVRMGGPATLVCHTQSSPTIEGAGNFSRSEYNCRISQSQVEQAGKVRAVVKIEGSYSGNGRSWLPFTVRLYLYAGSDRIKMVHSFVFDGNQESDFISGLGVRFSVPFREALYNRHVAFSGSEGGVWSEPVQPLVGRRFLTPPTDSAKTRTSSPLILQQQQMEGMRIPDYNRFDAKSRSLIDQWASWNDFKLSQLTDKAFTVRKRTKENTPWWGTFSSTRSTGACFVGDVSGGLSVALQDFWQSYPAALEVNGACSTAATLTVWLWSPDAAPMDLRHYDTVAHGLEASYEDVQEGMSTPYGVARTHTLMLMPVAGYAGKQAFATTAACLTSQSQLLCTPAYLHEKGAFGLWSLPDSTTPLRASVEKRMRDYFNFYHRAVDENCWYGFWNYGDVMHAYDAARHEWRYDVGGYAWDNTELGTNMWLWYYFLRTGDERCWQMAVAMTRHTSEVDVYHAGPYAGLGSRHNVSHWGCGAKEARISQAAWNRFYYYLTGDERCGDLMHAVRDADTLLYHLDPMRLAQPRDQYPCSAPARLRVGPDWLAYAGNWMTEWERTRNPHYRDKIVAGMKSIAALPHGIFSGPLALGYDPATGILSSECDTALQNTNHLLPLMGGFEVMNEMMTMIDVPEWRSTWLDFTAQYREKADRITHNHFVIPRLAAYAAYHLHSAAQRRLAWKQLLDSWGENEPLSSFTSRELLPPQVPALYHEDPFMSTNSVATWCLDAIYMLEVCPNDN